ncbi:MAG: TlpA disulfide reductase family protein [Brumimicrobium sp.]|nr:TlpA disulfide reductase family protein [Brumimicrobium sp.]
MRSFYRSLIILSITLLSGFSVAQKLNYGYWNATLKINDTLDLPFLMHTQLTDQELIFAVYNGEEEIRLAAPKVKGDSIEVSFKAFNTSLIFTISKSKKLCGYYFQPDRTRFKRIPFRATYAGKKSPVENYSSTYSVAGRWKTIFSPNEGGAYPAIGKFEQNENNVVTGTFLTETGDYRFLKGYLSGKELTLSTFDGSHAFLFRAHLEGDSLKGMFFSGRHWSTNWIASRNENYSLSDPDSITYLVEDTFHFSFPTVKGTDYLFPNEELKGKVIIVQIIGTWCPNCLDETNFYKELYEKYHEQGLEIIGVAYEYPAGFDEQAERVKRYASNKNIPYPILIGGQASKDEASKDFPMLNSISSFPTSVLINRKGEIVKIHTGFNGPGTDEVYQQYVRETQTLLEKLLNE